MILKVEYDRWWIVIKSRYIFKLKATVFVDGLHAEYRTMKANKVDFTVLTIDFGALIRIT